MPKQPYSNSKAQVGLFLAFCLGLLVVMLVTYGHFLPLWKGSLEINVAFVNAGALQPNASVRYNGVEVGRVRRLRVLYLDDEQLERLLPLLTKQNLDNLPLRPEKLRKELRAVPDTDFAPRCRAALRNRTMIELTLDVLQESDVQRYHVDDQIRIVSTVFGDAAVEIVSGHGSVYSGGSRQLLLGAAGDFFSNLARSMSEVKDILSNVTDVVGTEERKDFARSRGRLNGISANLDKLARLANNRAGETGKKFDGLTGEISRVIGQASSSLDSTPAQTEHTAENVKAGLKALGERFEGTQNEARKAAQEVAADFKPVREDFEHTLDACRPDWTEMRTKIRAVYDKMGGLSGQLEELRETAGRLVSQSAPDMARTGEALRNGLVYLKQMGQAAMENKDLMLSEKDKGEHEYATVESIYRGMCRAARRIREAAAETEETAQMAAASSAGASPVAGRAQAASSQLLALYGKVAAVRDAIEAKMLPEFERKKAVEYQKALPQK